MDTWIEQLDKDLFLFLNSFHNSFLDFVMVLVSHKLTWLPLYGVFIYLLFKNYGKKAIIMMISAILLIVLSDQFSVIFFKNTFLRFRPCHNLEIKHLVHLVNEKCGGKYGFVSSHAANVFAIATLMTLFLKNKIKYIAIVLFLWALVVSYSRIYLGVHYPLDIIGGAMLGICLGILVYKIYFFIERKYDLDEIQLL